VGDKRTIRRAASARPAQVVAAKILRAERTVELEIERNGGTYPHNGGDLTEEEVCRRAGVSPLALKGLTHSTGTRIQLAAWLRRIDEPRLATTRRPQSTAALKSQLEQIAHHFQQANLDVATLRLRVQKLEHQRLQILRQFEALEGTLPPPPARGRR
jgi:hypothetical protein